jgi:cytochrome c oxidase subunit 4
MARTKLYTAIYVVLFVVATVQVGLEGMLSDEMYLPVFAAIMVLSFAKAFVVAGYYQHLRWEPRSVTYVAATGLLAAVVLTVAAAYSIT